MCAPFPHMSWSRPHCCRALVEDQVSTTVPPQHDCTRPTGVFRSAYRSRPNIQHKAENPLTVSETQKPLKKYTNSRPAAITITRSWFIGSQHCLDFLTRWHVVVNTLMVVAVKAAVWVPWVGTDHSCATVIRSSISWSLCCMPAMNTRTLGYWEVSCNSAVALKTLRV